MWQRAIDCLGLTIEISTPLAELAPQLTAVFRTYADSSHAADVSFRLDVAERPQLVRDGAPHLSVEHVADLVPTLELEVYRQVIARVLGLVLHAGAVVGVSGAAIVVTGRSGAGKSTLVRALLARGFRYLSEESVALFGDARVRGLGRALHVDDPAIAVPPGYACDEYVIRGRPRGAFRLLHPPEHVIWRGDARTAALIAIDHAADAPDTLERLSGGAALAAVWPTAFRQGPDVLDLAAIGLAGVATYRLHTTRPEHALDRVLALAGELGVTAH